jgi:hypothetical protein
VVQVRLLLLAAICGEHLLLIGPPGTAKSELVRAQRCFFATDVKADSQDRDDRAAG